MQILHFVGLKKWRNLYPAGRPDHSNP